MEKIYCNECKKSLCAEHTYSYVDGNNISITKNSPTLCKKCYEKKYNEKIMTDIERFKNHFIDTLLRFKHEQKMDTVKVDNLIAYISNS